MALDLDALVRDALKQHAMAIYQATDPSMSPWPDDADSSLLRFSSAIVEVLDTCQEWENQGVWEVPREVRLRLAVSLGLVAIAR